MAAMTPFRGGLEIWVVAWEESKKIRMEER
jgi:hypothetical protein